MVNLRGQAIIKRAWPGCEATQCDEIGVEEEYIIIYKYLGCVMNEHLQCMRMVEERAKEGVKHKVTSSEGTGPLWGRLIKGATFVRRMNKLVEYACTGRRYGASIKCADVGSEDHFRGREATHSIGFPANAI